MTDGGADKLSAASDSLTKALHQIGESLYKAQQAAGAAAGGTGGPTGGAQGQAPGQPHGQGEVVDAEFVDVDDSKKPN